MKAQIHELKLLSDMGYCYFQRMRLRECSFLLLCAQLHAWYICVVTSVVFMSCDLTAEVKLFIVMKL